MITSGISYPSGWTIVTAGTTQTITQTFTSTTTSAPWITPVGYALFFFGFYFFIEVWTAIIMGNDPFVRKVRDVLGF